MGLSAKKNTSEGRVVIKKKSFLFREKNARKKYCYRKSCYVLAPRGGGGGGAYSSPEKHVLIRERGLIWEVGLIEDLRYLFFVTANTMMQLCDILQRMEWNNTIIMVSG